MNSEKEFSGKNGDNSFVNVLVQRLFSYHEVESNDHLNSKKHGFMRGMLLYRSAIKYKIH